MTSALFSPIRLAGLDLVNRIVVSPMCQYSADDGVATGWHFTHLGTLANSGAALVVVEATGTERRGRITHGCPGLYSDDCEVLDNPHWGWHAAKVLGAEVARPKQYQRAAPKAWPGAMFAH